MQQTPLDLRSLATAPPLAFPTQTWEATLPAGVDSSLRGVQTSVALEAASLAQSAVGVSASISVPAAGPGPVQASSSGGAAGRPTGVVGGLVGMGVVAGVGALVL